jgi:hypothetical protein
MRFSPEAAQSHLNVSVRQALPAARASSSFVVHLQNSQGEGVTVLSAAQSGLWGAFARLYGDKALDLWEELVRAPRDRLLPATRRALTLAYTIVEREAAAATAAGEASQRSAEGLRGRARAIMLLEEYRHGRARGGATACLLRRMVRASTALVRSGGEVKTLAHWRDLEGLVAASGWQPLTRQSSGYLVPCAERPGGGFDPEQRRTLLAHHMPCLNAGALVEEWTATFGPPSDTHPIWTLAAHAHAHMPAVQPHLEEAVAASLARGEPLRLYKEGVTSRSPREQELMRNELTRQVSMGVLEGPLTPQQIMDASYCKIITRMGCVFKGTLAHSEPEKQALATGDLRALAALAAERAQKVVGRVVELLAATSQWRRGGALERAQSDALGEITKTRLVNEAQALAEQGSTDPPLLPRGIHPFSYSPVHISELLEGARTGMVVGKRDCCDFFYHVFLQEAFKPYCCQIVDVGDGMHGPVEVYRSTRGNMGLADTGGACQAVSTIICIIATARLEGLLSPAGVCAYLDDLVATLRDCKDAPAASACLTQLFHACSLKEALKKRCDFAPSNEVLGRQWDLEHGTVSLPVAKRLQYMTDLHTILALLQHPDPVVRGEVTTPTLESLAGKLAWWAEVSTMGATRLGPLWAILHHGNSLNHDGRRQALVQCLQWWTAQAGKGGLEGVVLLDGAQLLGAEEMAVDASSSAICAVDKGGRRMAWRLLTAAERTEGGEVASPSGYREMLAIELGVARLCPAWAQQRVLFLTDATACLGPLHSGRSSGARTDAVVQRIFKQVDALGVTQIAFWAPRETNTVPDAGSKCISLEAAQAYANSIGYTMMQ